MNENSAQRYRDSPTTFALVNFVFIVDVKAASLECVIKLFVITLHSSHGRSRYWIVSAARIQQTHLWGAVRDLFPLYWRLLANSTMDKYRAPTGALAVTSRIT